MRRPKLPKIKVPEENGKSAIIMLIAIFVLVIIIVINVPKIMYIMFLISEPKWSHNNRGICAKYRKIKRRNYISLSL